MIHGSAVNGDFFVDIGNFVARQTDHALDVINIRLHWIMKDDNIAALDRFAIGNALVDDGQSDAVGKFVDQNQVINLQVGIMEPDGIRKGSKTNERSRKTASMMGNKPAVQSSHQGCLSKLFFAS